MAAQHEQVNTAGTTTTTGGDLEAWFGPRRTTTPTADRHQYDGDRRDEWKRRWEQEGDSVLSRRGNPFVEEVGRWLAMMVQMEYVEKLCNSPARYILSGCNCDFTGCAEARRHLANDERFAHWARTVTPFALVKSVQVEYWKLKKKDERRQADVALLRAHAATATVAEPEYPCPKCDGSTASVPACGWCGGKGTVLTL